MKINYVLYSTLLLFPILSGCTKHPPSTTFHSVRDTIRLQKESVPANGIYAVSDVVIQQRGGNDYEFAAAGIPTTSKSILRATTYCRVSQFAAQYQFNAWYPQMAVDQLASLDGPRTFNVIVTFVRGTLPADASADEMKRNWCQEVAIN